MDKLTPVQVVVFFHRRPESQRAIVGLLSWLACVVGRSRVCHVSVAIGDVARDPSLRGDRLYGIVPYTLAYPYLSHCRVHDMGMVDPEEITHRMRVRRPLWKVFGRYLSLGLMWKEADCVGIVCRVAGLRPCLTPGGLDRQLARAGWETHALA